MIDSGNTAWMLMSCALVLLMTPGLAIFYGGMVRAKNVLSTLLHSFFAMGLATLAWVTLGYSLAFGQGNRFIGGFEYAFLQGVGTEPGPFADDIPHIVFVAFQMMFAIITPALISGAFAERIRFRAYVVFTLVWSLLVYAPVCHWVWGPGGWLGELGALDFAGGTVVHVNSGVAALAMILVLGRRIDWQKASIRPHNLALTLLGAGLLWFGWFGFNAGSALAANGYAGWAFMMTHVAAATGAITWAGVETFHRKHTSALGVASGAVAGLVAITPACAFVGLGGALAIGAGAGILCYLGVLLKERFGYDDSLDAFGVHGLGGAWGALATGIFAVSAVGGASGLIEGNFEIVGIQVISILATAAYTFGVTYALSWALDRFMGLRVPEHHERTGLDLIEHGEAGYAIDEPVEA